MQGDLLRTDCLGPVLPPDLVTGMGDWHGLPMADSIKRTQLCLEHLLVLEGVGEIEE